MRVFKFNLTIQLILVFAVVSLFGTHIPEIYKSCFYAISLSLKEVLVFLLPFIIVSCLLHSLVSNQNHALKFIIILLVTVCFSNLLSILAAYYIGYFGLQEVSLTKETTSLAVNTLNPYWSFKLPQILSNEIALMLGVVFGLIFAFFPNSSVNQFSKKSNALVSFFLQKCFVPVLPLFALGFIVKMQQEGILTIVINHYGSIVLLLILGNLAYIVFMFALAARFKPKILFSYLKNVLPAGILGFSTMSSMATMPVTLEAAEKNTGNQENSRAIIPATVNIHMIGDSISIPILAMAVLLTFGKSLPSITQFLLFTQFFMLAKFAVPGIPCGTIFVMIPILEKTLGFTGEMSSFIATIYILFDSIITAGNVLGNSALVIFLSSLLERIFKGAKKSVDDHESDQQIRSNNRNNLVVD